MNNVGLEQAMAESTLRETLKDVARNRSGATATERMVAALALCQLEGVQNLQEVRSTMDLLAAEANPEANPDD